MNQAETILAARTDARMSQEHLAKAAGVSVRTVIRGERGQNISDESLRAICAVLDLDASLVPAASGATLDADALVASLSQAMDRPSRRATVEALVRHVADVMPDPRMVLRPDILAMRRSYVRNQGVRVDPSRSDFFGKVIGLWYTLFLGSLLALVLFHVAWGLLVAPIGESGWLFTNCLVLWLLAIMFCVVPIVDWEARRQQRLSLTLFVLDATHLHEFRARHMAHLKDAAPTMLRRSVRIDRITSVEREDAEGYASFKVKTEAGKFDMCCLVRSDEAGEVERLLGSMKVTPPRATPVPKESLAVA